MVQTNWTSLGQPASNITLSTPHAVQNADGRIEVLLNGSDGNLWHIWQTAPNNGWSNWASLNKPPNTNSFSVPVAAKNADGHIEAFSVGSDGNLWRIWQIAPNNGWLDHWESSGKPLSSVGLVEEFACMEINTNGRLEVFVTGTDGALWHLYQLNPNGNWGNFTSLEKPRNVNVNALGTGKNADGRIEVFTIGDDGNLWHIWQTDSGKSWGPWYSLGTPTGTATIVYPFVIANADGRLEAFTSSAEGALWHTWQVWPGGNWG